MQQHHGRGASQTISLGVFTAHRDGFVFDAASMANISLETVCRYFHLPLVDAATGAPHPLAVFADQIWQVLRGAGEGLRANGYADFAALVDDVIAKEALAAGAPPRAWPLIERFVEVVPAFNDRAMYAPAGAAPVPVLFMKKAQLAVGDLHRRFRATDPARFAFADIETLTVFVDNVLPCMLRLEGVLKLDASLQSLIESRTPLGWASQQEVELRACALVACHRLSELGRAQGLRMIEADLDYYLWLLGKRDGYRDAERHYCPATLYY